MDKRCRSQYRDKLNEIESVAGKLSQTTYNLHSLASTLCTSVIAWEAYFTSADQLDTHPYDKAEKLFGAVLSYLMILISQDKYTFGSDFEAAKECLTKKMEDGHQDLFEELWVRFSEDDYRKRILDYSFRLKLNELESFVEGHNCIDFGCGHGNFGQALIGCGARSVLGLDYGEGSISFAKKAARRLGTKNLHFKVASVYNSGEDSDKYDFAVQNGVFHHLQDEDRAYAEVNRVLKNGGHFWIYTDGIDNIQGELQDTCSRIMRRWDQDAVHAVLDQIGLSSSKRYHIGDTFNAIYRHTDYESMSKRLGAYGFEVVRRLQGGFPYDSDGEALTRRWATELYGSGDIRILAKKIHSIA